ncbi:exported hypothetical protein [Candidatus Sulfopaludibacter sp. SbA4]|nr:exported hypothetical protein [Candidatus Sulfopaludibacter sp. SbA4]
MTCNAAESLAAAAIGALAVALIQPGYDTLLVAAIGVAALLQPGLAATHRTAVALAAITMPANAEWSVASAVAADPLVENQLVRCHVRPQAGLDNGCRIVAG